MIPLIGAVARRPYLLPGLVVRRVINERRRRRDLTAARAIIPTLPPVGGTGPPGAWHIQHVEWPKFSPTGVTVMLIGPRGQAARVALKLPHTDQGVASLRRQESALAALRADERLHEWRSLVAETLAEGTAGTQFYMAETALPGRTVSPLRLDPPTRERMQASAARAIAQLHASIAGPVVVDEARLTRWVDTPLCVIQRATRSLPAPLRHPAALTRIRAELYETLAGQTVATSWIHGDYWLGNLLVDVKRDRVVGIVDWERAAADELPAHDLMHLLLFTRQQLHQWNEADVVAGITGRIPWTIAERTLLDAAQAPLPGTAVAERPLTLLYWLRHMAGTLSLLPDYARNREYLMNHVECVLRCL